MPNSCPMQMRGRVVVLSVVRSLSGTATSRVPINSVQTLSHLLPLPTPVALADLQEAASLLFPSSAPAKVPAIPFDSPWSENNAGLQVEKDWMSPHHMKERDRFIAENTSREASSDEYHLQRGIALTAYTRALCNLPDIYVVTTPDNCPIAFSLPVPALEDGIDGEGVPTPRTILPVFTSIAETTTFLSSLGNPAQWPIAKARGKAPTFAVAGNAVLLPAHLTGGEQRAHILPLKGGPELASVLTVFNTEHQQGATGLPQHVPDHITVNPAVSPGPRGLYAVSPFGWPTIQELSLMGADVALNVLRSILLASPDALATLANPNFNPATADATAQSLSRLQITILFNPSKGEIKFSDANPHFLAAYLSPAVYNATMHTMIQAGETAFEPMSLPLPTLLQQWPEDIAGFSLDRLPEGVRWQAVAGRRQGYYFTDVVVTAT